MPQAKIITMIELDVETAAKWFAEMDDDTQAKFFVEVAKHSLSWSHYAATRQWYLIGSHLKNCECATDEAREIVREMYDGLQNGTH